MLVIFGAILLYKYLTKLDEKTGKVTATINSLKESFDGLKDSIIGAGNAVNDFMENITDVMTGDFSSIGRLID